MTDSTWTPSVPEGYVWRGDLIAQGWKGAWLDALEASAIKLADVPEGQSPRAYPLDVIAEAEQADAKIRKALTAVRDCVPATGAEYTRENTLSRVAVLGRDWTPAHLERLLGGPDMIVATAGGHEAFRWGRDRVEWAEANDAKLIVTRKRAADKRERKIAGLVDAGENVFRRVDGRWLVVGTGLKAGQEVTVSKKDGTSTQVVICDIVNEADGVQYATSRRPTRPRPARPARRSEPVRYEPQRYVPHPDAPVVPTTLVYEPLPEDRPVRYCGKPIMVTSARRVRLREDEEYMDYEYGWLTTYREATPEETADLEEREAAARAAAIEQRRINRLREHVKKLFRDQGERPERVDEINGRELVDTRHPMGYGTVYVIDTDAERIWQIDWHGGDSDLWAGNYGETRYASWLPLTDELVAQLEDLDAHTHRGPIYFD